MACNLHEQNSSSLEKKVERSLLGRVLQARGWPFLLGYPLLPSAATEVALCWPGAMLSYILHITWDPFQQRCQGHVIGRSQTRRCGPLLHYGPFPEWVKIKSLPSLASLLYSNRHQLSGVSAYGVWINHLPVEGLSLKTLETGPGNLQMFSMRICGSSLKPDSTDIS